jgi:hypothetical protein
MTDDTLDEVRLRCNISNTTMKTGIGFLIGIAIWLKCEDLKSSPVRIGGFEMTSHTNKSLLNGPFAL